MKHLVLKSVALAAVVTSICFGSLFAAANEFTGEAGTSDWQTDGNWSLGHKPTSADDVVIPSGKTVKSAAAIVAGSLTIADGTLELGDESRPPVSADIAGDLTLSGASKLVVYAGRLAETAVFSNEVTAVAALRAAANVVTIGGTFAVRDASVVFPDADDITGVPVFFRTQDFTLTESARIETTKRGWGWSGGAWADAPAYAKRRYKERTATDDFWTFAFGAGFDYFLGGNYGHDRAAIVWNGSTYCAPYGSPYAPFLPGSPSGDYYATSANPRLGRGPGSAVILARGTMRVDGRIVADADSVPVSGADGGRPSGGGIWLAMRDGSFGPKARLSANGGTATYGYQFGPGDGGRIAVAVGLTDAQLDSLLEGDDPGDIPCLETVPFCPATVDGGVNTTTLSKAGAGTLRTLLAEGLTYVTVAGNPAATDGVTPAVGVHTVTNGTTVRFTASAYGYALDLPGQRFSCNGYVVSNRLGQVAAGAGQSVDVEIAEGPLSVTWQWGKREWGVTLKKPEHASFATNGVAVAGDVGFWTEDATPTVAVVPDAGWSFLRWDGNVPIEKALSNPLSFVATNTVTAVPELVPVTRPADATLVACLSGTASAFSKAIAVSGTPLAFVVELAEPADGVTVALTLVDAKGKSFSSNVTVDGTFALWPLADAYWTGPAGASAIAWPVSVSSVAVTDGTAELKNLRAAYAQRMGRAARHFAAFESRQQPLNGTIATEGETVAVPAAGIRVVLHQSRTSKFSLVWDNKLKSTFQLGVKDQTEKLLADFCGLAKGTAFTIPEANLTLEQNGNTRQFVRPLLRRYRSNSVMTEIGYDYLADHEQLPTASEHVLELKARPLASGVVQLWLDGSIAYTVSPPRSTPDARLASVQCVFGAGAEYAVNPDVPAYDAGRYEILDLSANPRAKAFKDAELAAPLVPGYTTLDGRPYKLAKPLDSGDVAICHYAQGEWAGEVDEYNGRAPIDGFGGAVHFRIPPRDYLRAHLVVALDPDEAKDRVLTLRLSYYTLNGCGAPLIADTTLDWSAGVDADATEVGSVVRDGKTIPLYAVTVPLDIRKNIPEAARQTYVDFDFIGVQSGIKPIPGRDSAFNIFAATLEAAPMTLDFLNAEGAPGNVFTRDEADRHVDIRLRSERAQATSTVSWTVRARTGEALFSGSSDVGPADAETNVDTRVDLASVTDPGLYLLDVTVTGDGGASVVSYQTRFAVLPPAGRSVPTEASPYATWWFWAHGSPADWSIGGPIMQKAGIRKSCHGNWPAEMMERYDVTFTGNCIAPSMSNFDAETGHFRPQGDLSGEQWFVTNVTQQIAAKPWVDHILIWHESAPDNGIPEEILGLPVPAATASDLKAGAYVNEIGRLVRQYFPNLRIQIGNTSASLGAACRPFRGGADPQYYDSVGIETPSQAMMPERLLVWGLQGMMMTKEAASFYAGRPVPAAGCYEYVYRTEKAIGEELQAAWYMRDVLISLANNMPLISPAITFDVQNCYYDTLWGRSGMLFRAPFCEPKLSYVAYAALTKALDGVTFLSELPTGSTTVYALHFRRCDGRYATALWCARGEADVALTVSGAGEVSDMLGRTASLGATVPVSEWPTYVVTANPVTAATVVNRAFRQASAASAKAAPILRLADADVAVEPDARIRSLGHACLPMMTPSTNFSVRTLVDGVRGRCLEVRLDTSVENVNRYYTEYTTLRPANPPAVPADTQSVGVWVKGNSNWGQVRFEITDADGDVFVNYTHPTAWDTLDWQGLLCVNFDGWAYVSCQMPNGPGLRYDEDIGLNNSPWSREVQAGNGKYDGPGRLTALTVGMNREKLDLIDFKATEPAVCLGDVRIESASATPLPEIYVNTFVGATGGDWSDPSNWSRGIVPTSNDDVLIPSGKMVKSTNSIAVASLTVNGGTFQLGTPVTGTDQRDRPHVSANITGDVTLTGAAKFYVYAGELQDYSVFASDATALAACAAAANVVTVGGDFSVGDTSVVYPEAAELTGVPVFFKVTGDVTVAEGASFDTRARGWGWSGGDWANHPENAKRRKAEGYKDIGWTVAIGAGLNYGLGGNYGSTSSGIMDSSWTWSKSYGYTFAPFMPGSPGGNYYASKAAQHSDGRGPGSIVIWAKGTMSVDGKMLADARINNGGDSCGPSGGGIWLAAKSFAFGANARLSAEGGDAKSSGVFAGGKGGRIALAEDCSDEELTTMLGGTFPDSLVEGPQIEGVTASVLGGQNYAKTARYGSGTLSTVRSKFVSASLMTRQTTGEDLVAEGVTWGDRVILNGEQSFTAPEFAYLKTDAGVRYNYAGFIVSNATSLVAENSDRSVRTATWTSAGKDGPYSLTWKWDTREIRVSGSITGEGAVTVDGVEHDESFEQWVGSGKSFDCTPVDATHFAYWAGSAVPSGYSTAQTLTIALTASKALVAAFATESVSRRWVGAANASWFAMESWEPAGAPTPLDDAYVTNATITVSTAIAAKSLTIAGSSKITFKAVEVDGESTAENLYTHPTVVKVTEKLTIDGTSVITVANDLKSGAAVRFDCGSFYLGASASITATKNGWYWYAGTDDPYRRVTESSQQTRAMGPGQDYRHGAGHGAKGGSPSGAYIGAAYGYKYAPFLPGSPNGLQGGINNGVRGGGTIWIKCGGLCELYGALTADGGNGFFCPSSGGGIWICAKGLKAAPTTSASAVGGNITSDGHYYGSHTAGGRIALTLGATDAQLDALAAGTEPAELGMTAQDGIDLFAASAKGGIRILDSYAGNPGTVTTVTGPLAFVNVVVSGEPVNALGVEPAYGTSAFDGGSVQTFTAPEYGIDPSDAGVRYACNGYVVSNALGEVSRGAGRSVGVTIANGPLAVTWFWGVAQKRALVRKPANGTLTIDGEPVNGDAVTWTAQTTASLGAVPDEGYEFVCWEGVLPIGNLRTNPLTVDLAKPLDVTPVFRPVANAMTRTWNGSGDWKDAAKWTPEGIPGAADTLVIEGGTCTVSNGLVAANLQVTGGTLDIGTRGKVNAEIDVTNDVSLTGGKVTLGYGMVRTDDDTAWRWQGQRAQGHARLAVGGNLALDNAAVLEVFGGRIENDYTFASGTSFVEVGEALTLQGTSKLSVFSELMSGGSVKITAKSVTVGETAKVDAYAKGYMWMNNDTPPDAPGLGFSYTAGASHGGRGSGESKPTYGFKLSPVQPGSPAGNYQSSQTAGGGLIRIHARAMSIDGTLNADGFVHSTYCGASGGGIWLTADRFAFGSTAVLTAKGGYHTYEAAGSNGGGGRIAIDCQLTDEQIASLAETGRAAGITKSQQLDSAAFAELYPGCTVSVAGGDAGEGRAGTFVYRRKPNALMLLVR